MQNHSKENPVKSNLWPKLSGKYGSLRQLWDDPIKHDARLQDGDHIGGNKEREKQGKDRAAPLKRLQFLGGTCSSVRGKET
jgi:hypothetical protein